MANEPIPVVPGTPAPAAPVVPAPTPTLQQQIADSLKPPAAPAAPAVPAPAVTPSDAAPVSPPATDSGLKDKLADAEKRLQDTQRWGHKNAEEASKLKTALTQIQNHPVLGKLLEVMDQPTQPNPQAEADAQEMRTLWSEYQTAKSDEEAFSKLMKFSEARGARRAMSEFDKVMTQRENETRVTQRNQQTVQVINKTVSESASDVPLELFWAMSGRAEAECPATITDYTERLQWQVGRAVDLSRGVLQPRVAQAVQAGVQQAGVNQAAGAIMAPGGAAPSGQPAGVPAKPVTMADYIKNMQRAQMTGNKA